MSELSRMTQFKDKLQNIVKQDYKKIDKMRNSHKIKT